MFDPSFLNLDLMTLRRGRSAALLVLLVLVLMAALTVGGPTRAQTQSSITWTGNSTEADANDGSVKGTVTATMIIAESTSFVSDESALFAAITSTNLPSRPGASETRRSPSC